jgi:hypothetical protein
MNKIKEIMKFWDEREESQIDLLKAVIEEIEDLQERDNRATIIDIP